VVKLALVILLLAAPRAHARCGHLDPCPEWLDAIGAGLAIALVGGYAVGTGVFVVTDVAHPDELTLAYSGTELGVNGSLGVLFGGAAIDAASHGDTKSALVLSGFTVLHTTLAIHGGIGVYDHRNEIHVNVPDDTWLWIAGMAYTTNTLIWAGQLPGRHGRGYGIAEAAVNGPLAIGFGYLAYDAARDWRGGPALGFGALAAISGALTVHGIRTAIHPTPSVDIDFSPTMVGDGSTLAISARGVW